MNGKDDARYSTLEQLHERRKQAVRLHRKGYGVMQIVELSGLSYPTVRAAIDRYEEGGLAAIRPATRGKRAGQGRTLTEEQEQAIRKIICDKRPEQLKMEFALWNRAAVMQLIGGKSRHCSRYARCRQLFVALGFHPTEADQEGLRATAGSRTNRSTSNTRKLRSGPRLKAARFTGVMRQPWSIPMYVAAANAPAGKTPVTYTVGGTVAETVDDCYGNESGQDALDDH